MSGRSGYRKTMRRVPYRSEPADMPPIYLRFTLPRELAPFVASGPTGIVGVTVKERDQVEVVGRDCAWMQGQAIAFLKRIATGRLPKIVFGAVMERESSDGPTASGPRRAGFRDLYTIAIASGDPVILMTPGGAKDVSVA